MTSFSPFTPGPSVCSPPGVGRAAFPVLGSLPFHSQRGVLWRCTPPPRHSRQGWDARGGPDSGVGVVGVGGVGVGAVVEGVGEEVEAGPGSLVQDAYSGYSEITREN